MCVCACACHCTRRSDPSRVSQRFMPTTCLQRCKQVVSTKRSHMYLVDDRACTYARTHARTPCRGSVKEVSFLANAETTASASGVARDDAARDCQNGASLWLQQMFSQVRRMSDCRDKATEVSCL